MAKEAIQVDYSVHAFALNLGMLLPESLLKKQAISTLLPQFVSSRNHSQYLSFGLLRKKPLAAK